MNKTPKATINARIEEILRIRLDGAELWDIREYVREKCAEAGSIWESQKCLSDAQLYRYLARADKLIAQSCRSSRKRLLRRHLAQRRNLYAKAVNAGDIRTALSVLSDEARLLDLYETYPDKKAAKDASAPMGTGDVVKVLSEQLREIDQADLPTRERTRLTATLAESLLRAIGISVLDARLEALQAVLSGTEGQGTDESQHPRPALRGLTPEERFRLILAAGGPGRRRGANATGCISETHPLSMPDYSPFCQAFAELAWHTFAELLDATGYYLERFWVSDSSLVEPAQDDAPSEARRGRLRVRRGTTLSVSRSGKAPALGAYAGTGLRSRLHSQNQGGRLEAILRGFEHPAVYAVPDHAGIRTVERALKLTDDGMSFKTEGMVRWMNTARRSGSPTETAKDIVSVESYRRECEACFRDRVRFWRG